MIFSIAMGAEYLSYVKSIATFAPTFYGYIISVLASVYSVLKRVAYFNSYQISFIYPIETGCEIFFEPIFNSMFDIPKVCSHDLSSTWMY